MLLQVFSKSTLVALVPALPSTEAQSTRRAEQGPAPARLHFPLCVSWGKEKHWQTGQGKVAKGLSPFTPLCRKVMGSSLHFSECKSFVSAGSSAGSLGGIPVLTR